MTTANAELIRGIQELHEKIRNEAIQEYKLQLKKEKSKQCRVTFNINEEMAIEFEKIFQKSRYSRNIIILVALKNYLLKHYYDKNFPFETEQEYNNIHKELFYRYSIILTDELMECFELLKQVYNWKNEKFNKSHIIRCALARFLNNSQ